MAAEEEDVLFLDANVLFSAAYRAESRLTQLWSLTGARLVTSRYAADEARRNLAGDEQQRRLADLLGRIQVVDTPFAAEHPALALVELVDKDRPVLVAAVEAKATHLLTGDARHFGALYGRRIAGVWIVRPAEYLRRVTSGSEDRYVGGVIDTSLAEQD